MENYQEYCDSVDDLRHRLWVLGNLEDARDVSEDFADKVETTKLELKASLVKICNETVEMLERCQLNTLDIRQHVFCNRIKGDFYGYIWENVGDEDALRFSNKWYYESLSQCDFNFEPTDPDLLRVALNYSALLRSAKRSEDAIFILQKTISNAKANVEGINVKTNSLYDSLMNGLEDMITLMI